MRFLFLTVAASLAALAQCPQDVVATGHKLEMERRWEDAARLYESALHSCPGFSADDRSWLLTSLAEMNYYRGEYQESRRWLNRAAKERPPENTRIEMQLLNARGALNLVEGKLSAAAIDLTRAVDLAGKLGAPAERAGALHNLAAVELRSGDPVNAEKHQREALDQWRSLGERDECILRAWVGLSSIQAWNRDWKAADKSLREALAIARTPEALSNYATVLDHLDRKREARRIRRELPPVVPVHDSLVDVRALSRRESDLDVRVR